MTLEASAIVAVANETQLAERPHARVDDARFEGRFFVSAIVRKRTTAEHQHRCTEQHGETTTTATSKGWLHHSPGARRSASSTEAGCRAARHGQLDTVQFAGAAASAKPGKVNQVSSVSSVEGTEGICVLGAAGGVRCWGNASFFPASTPAVGCTNFASGSAQCVTSPTTIPLPGAVSDLDVSLFNAVTLVDGRVYAWGRNMYGETGHPPGSMADVGSQTPAPVGVQGLPE